MPSSRRHRPAAITLAALSLFGAARPTLAASEAPRPVLTPQDADLVAKAVTYLQNLTTAKGRFVQSDARGGVSQGAFFLQRPGRARFDYDPPSRLAIASDGHEVSVVDRRLKTIQSYPLGLTPLALFLAKDIRFDRGVTIQQVTHAPQSFTVVARDARKKTQGQIALTFSESPVALAGWAVTDAQGAVVRVHLLDFAASAPHAAKFFQLYDHSQPSDGATAR